MNRRNLYRNLGLGAVIGLGFTLGAVRYCNQEQVEQVPYVTITGKVRLDPATRAGVVPNYDSLSIAEVEFFIQTDYGVKAFRCSEYSDKEKYSVENLASKAPVTLRRLTKNIKLGSGLENRLSNLLKEGTTITLEVPEDIAEAIMQNNKPKLEADLQAFLSGKPGQYEWFAGKLLPEYIVELRD